MMDCNRVMYSLIDSLDFNECCLRKTMLIQKLKRNTRNKPMNLAEKMEHKKEYKNKAP